MPVLYQDEALVVVSKPSGLLVHRTEMSRDREFLLQRVRDQLGRHLYPVHRLDRPTSGALVFAFTSEDARAIHDSLKGPAALKEYVAMVRREAEPSFHNAGTIGGKEARTDFVCVATCSRSSLVEARPATGRRHQIRKHLARLAHHILGDTSYGKGQINQFFRETYALPRLFLHAHRLAFPHPRSGAPVEVLAPLAPDLRAFLSRLPDLDPAPLIERWGYDPTEV